MERHEFESVLEPTKDGVASSSFPTWPRSSAVGWHGIDLDSPDGGRRRNMYGDRVAGPIPFAACTRNGRQCELAGF